MVCLANEEGFFGGVELHDRCTFAEVAFGEVNVVVAGIGYDVEEVSSVFQLGI